MDIPSSESGTVRLFHLDLPPEAIERFTAQAGTGEWPLQYALGADRLRPGFVEVISVREILPMTLSSYLAEAYGLGGEEFRGARSQIDALTGHVVIVPSEAFGHQAQTLTVASPLRWIGTFSEPQGTRAQGKVRSKAAEGHVQPGGTGTRSIGGSPLLRALIIVVSAFTLGVLAYAFGLGR
ncbi:aspartate carbamoyltransferase catalytic subunit [Litorisediminicola beolgyonensis]|uniref:Aspartate carbamoyltransferase catalytic subunit n=1 Tax=Litorisediminicola beolgyonensis TaxID=1173614 RepID=A0ABW3ZM02_9RHOB